MKRLQRSIVTTPKRPVRILQFGEGNFLRAFADWMIQVMNDKTDFDAGVTVIQPIEKGNIEKLNEQEGLYTLLLNGIKNGQLISQKKLIDCIQVGINPYLSFDQYLELGHNPDLRFVISNTTEAGIAYHEGNRPSTTQIPSSFPAKVTMMLKRRFDHFNGASDKGLIFLPCELIDRNGDQLKKIILQYATEWGFSEQFITWIEQHNIFTNTLVDRIVPGYPASKAETLFSELNYDDQLVVEAEPFHLWVIEGPDQVEAEFPASTCGLNVIFTDDMEPYRTRKVRILNGAHTLMVPVAVLLGQTYVRESIEDELIGSWVKRAIIEEICPTLDFPIEALKSYAEDVIERFRNPFIKHALMSISLNSIAKFKTRVLPSLLAYVDRNGTLPTSLCVSFAAWIAFYRGVYRGNKIALNDSPSVITSTEKIWSAFEEHQSLERVVTDILSQTDFWGQDLSLIKGLKERLTQNLQSIVNAELKALIKHSQND